jgi:hypothetical protein
MESTEENYKQCSRDWGLVPARAVTKVNFQLGPRRVRQFFRLPPRYCCGGTEPSQVAIAAMLTRTTASA